MKGLSEMVGAALLIAVVMFTGALVATWGPTWVAGERASLTCVSNTNYIVEGVNFDKSSGNLYVKVSNYGSEPLYGFGLTLYNGSVSMQFGHLNVSQGGITEKNRLHRGGSTYITAQINNTRFGETIERVIVTNEACLSVTTEANI